MSVTIDRIIKKAEKFVKFGDFQAAKMACSDALETYPENPRLQALAERLAKPQVGNQHRIGKERFGLPTAIKDELEDLINSKEWALLTKRCLELVQHHSNSARLLEFSRLCTFETGATSSS